MRVDFQDLVDDFERDLQLAGREVFRQYVEKVRNQPQVPFRFGFLRAGIQLVSQSYSNGVVSAVAESQTRSKRGNFDYPAFLDEAESHGHKGWWAKANKQSILEETVDQVLPRFNL